MYVYGTKEGMDGRVKSYSHTYESCGSLCPIWWSWSESVWLFETPGTKSPWKSPGQDTGVVSCSLPQGIFSVQGLNPGLPHCRWIHYQLIHAGSPVSNMHHLFFSCSIHMPSNENIYFSTLLIWPGMWLLWEILYSRNDSNNFQDLPMWVLVFPYFPLCCFFSSFLCFFFFFYLYWDTELAFSSVWV